MNKRYEVTTLFKEECKSNVGQYVKTGKIHVIEDNIDITEDDNLIDFEINDNCYINDKFIGTTVCKKITVNILNPDNNIDLENKEISVQTGMVINNIAEVVPFGNYIIPKPDEEEVKEKTSFIGYDYMLKFNMAYKNRVTYPISAGELFEDTCEQAGVEVGNANFTNSNYMILGNPFTNNEDCRTVLSNIAQLAGGFARIGRDNKVYIISLRNDISSLLTVEEVNSKLLEEVNVLLVEMMEGKENNADESLNGNNYLDDFSKNNQWGEVNSLVLRISGIEGENTTVQDESSIQENGLTEIVIEDNYFLTNQEEREKVINPLWNTLKGIQYLPFKTSYYGYPYLDAGDMIYIQDTKDVGYISYVFNHTFKFNGGYSGSLETPAMTKTQTAYKNTVNNKRKFKQVERKIDKINGVIEDIIEEQTETTNKITQVEQTVDGISQNVTNLETTLSEDYSTTTEMNTAIEQSASSITSEVTEKIDSIQVGGTNLVPNSAPYDLDDYVIADSTAIELTLQDEETAPFGKCIRLKSLKDLTASSNGIFIYLTQDTLEVGKQYSFSLWMKATANTNMIVGYGAGGQTNFTVTTEYKKFTYTFTASTPTSDRHAFLIYMPRNTIEGRQVFVHSIKLEEGNKITAWSPAPTDNPTKSEMNSTIEQTAENINIEVSKKVGKDEVISSINQSAEQIQINADKINLERKRNKFN